MTTFLALSGGKDSMACLFLLKDSLAGAIYVDTGYGYPETAAVIDYAETLVPVHRVRVNRDAQQTACGIPADVVPLEWTVLGQHMTHQKPYRIQTSMQCCYDNIAQPLLQKAKALGATHLVYGQRDAETHRATARDGDETDGLIRLHPIESWTTAQVMDFLRQHMEIPAHFRLTHSSLDCYDCTAFRQQSQDRIEWTKTQYPAYYAAYAQKYNAILSAVEAAL